MDALSGCGKPGYLFSELVHRHRRVLRLGMFAVTIVKAAGVVVGLLIVGPPPVLRHTPPKRQAI